MQKLPDKIKTITAESDFKLKEKGSTFISISKHIENVEDAASFLNSIRKKYYDSTHHCYSYQLVDGFFKYSDDGEPNGTAGLRIYNAQNHFELTNLITVVVRYFGGVKLGVGPLGKAYYDSAIQNLSQSRTEELKLFRQIEIEYNFTHSKLVHHLLAKYAVKIVNSLFEPVPKIIGSILQIESEKFELDLTTMSNNQIKFFATEKVFYLK